LSASLLGRFTPNTHWMGDWVGPSRGLDVVRGKCKVVPVLN